MVNRDFRSAESGQCDARRRPKKGDESGFSARPRGLPQERSHNLRSARVRMNAIDLALMRCLTSCKLLPVGPRRDAEILEVTK